MPSRGSSDASSHIRRAKSFSSIRRPQHVPIPIPSLDPETSHQHAIVAAQVAMGRASERSSGETSRLPAPTRNNSTKSNSTTTVTPSLKPEVVRYVGQNKLRRNCSVRRKHTSSVASTAEALSKGSPGSLLTAVARMSDDCLGDGFDSTPSSYRKLRKAKSMFSPRKRALSVFSGSPLAQSEASQFRGVGRQSFERGESRGSLRLRRSISFVREGGEQLAKVFERKDSTANDAAIQLARDQFLHQLEQQRLRERPSFLFAPRQRRQQKAFRRTVRTSSTTSYGPAISSSSNRQTFEVDKVESSDTRRRSFSASIKNRFKRVFGRPSDKESFPAQQLDATRPHFRDYISADSGVRESYEDTPTLNERSISGKSRLVSSLSRVPTLRLHPSNEDIHSKAGSIRSTSSLESLSMAPTSRISSWTDSTTANTISRGIAVERKRLSVIQEHGGPHQPSSSAGRVGDGYSVFRKPLRSHSGANKLGSQVDPQRVYSALVKRIDENSPPKDQAVGPVEESTGDSGLNSVKYQRYGTTIKAVPKELTVDLAAAEAFSRPSSQQSHVLRKPISPRNKINITPQQLAQQNEGLLKLPRQPLLRQVRSTFFPFTTGLKPQTPSPFKLAMTTRQDSQLSSDDDAGSVIVSGKTGTHVPRATEPYRDGSATGSGSVYSRSTDGGTPKGVEKPPSPSPSEQDVEPGTAIIITNVSKQPQRPLISATQVPMHVAKSSGDWKTWVNSQMTTLDRQTSLQNRQHESRRQPPLHYRENAQIDGDDTDVGKVRYESVVSLNSSGSSSHQALTLSKRLFHSPLRRQPSTMNDRFPLIETKSLQRKRSNASLHSQRQPMSPEPSHYGDGDENHQLSTMAIPRSSSRLRMRASQVTLNSVRNYSNPHYADPKPASSNHPPEKNIIVFSSSESVAAPLKDLIRPQSSLGLRENYRRSTPSVLRKTPSIRTGLRNQHLIENRRLTRENLPAAPPEKIYDGDDESPASGQVRAVSKGSSKRMVDLFLSSRRHLSRRRKASSNMEDGGMEDAFI